MTTGHLDVLVMLVSRTDWLPLPADGIVGADVVAIKVGDTIAHRDEGSVFRTEPPSTKPSPFFPEAGVWPPRPRNRHERRRARKLAR